MAKNFFSLDEAAEQLRKSTDEVKRMAEQGKLQSFRDRGQLMFKREDIEREAGGGGGGGGGEEEEIRLADDSAAGTTPPEKVDLMADTDETEAVEPKSGTASGVSVFEGEEEGGGMEEETQAGGETMAEDDTLSFDSVGSGSGLLDLTRETDDTSLGAVELLEEVSPTEPSDAKIGDVEGALPSSASGIFEGAEGAPSEAGGLGELEEPGEPVAAAAAAYAYEEYDPTGDGFGGGALLGVFVTLVVALIVAVTGAQGLIVQLTDLFAENLWAYIGGLAALCLILMGTGYFIGRSRG